MKWPLVLRSSYEWASNGWDTCADKLHSANIENHNVHMELEHLTDKHEILKRDYERLWAMLNAKANKPQYRVKGKFAKRPSISEF